MNVFLRKALFLVLFVLLCFVGFNFLRDRLSHGPFYLEVVTDERQLEGVVVTLFASTGTTHGNRAIYFEQRIAANGVRIEFPRRFIQWFGEPQMVVALNHPLLTGRSYYLASYLTKRGEARDLGVVDAEYLQDYLRTKRSEIERGAAENKWDQNLAGDMLGGEIYSHALRITETYREHADAMTKMQKASWLAAVEELQRIAERTPARDAELNRQQIQRLKSMLE